MDKWHSKFWNEDFDIYHMCVYSILLFTCFWYSFKAYSGISTDRRGVYVYIYVHVYVYIYLQ
jgi:hypothetical protein